MVPHYLECPKHFSGFIFIVCGTPNGKTHKGVTTSGLWRQPLSTLVFGWEVNDSGFHKGETSKSFSACGPADTQASWLRALPTVPLTFRSNGIAQKAPRPDSLPIKVYGSVQTKTMEPNMECCQLFPVKERIPRAMEWRIILLHS